jgi:hypothetical protein
MSFIVERYLPGLNRAELVRSLRRLEQVIDELSREGMPIRYVGSTIVADDEACFCQFDAPCAAIVVEANTRAGLPFDRIVAADSIVVRGRSGSE